MTTRDRRLPAYLRGEPAAAGPALHKRGDVHRDQHDNVIENYHLLVNGEVCGCQPADARTVIAAALDAECVESRDFTHCAAWHNEARAYLAAHLAPED